MGAGTVSAGAPLRFRNPQGADMPFGGALWKAGANRDDLALTHWHWESQRMSPSPSSPWCDHWFYWPLSIWWKSNSGSFYSDNHHRPQNELLSQFIDSVSLATSPRLWFQEDSVLRLKETKPASCLMNLHKSLK